MNNLTFAINLQQIRPLESLFKKKKKVRYPPINLMIKILNVKLGLYLKSKEVVREVPIVNDGRVKALQKEQKKKHTSLILFNVIYNLGHEP